MNADRVAAASHIIRSLADRTGVTSDAQPRRYLWTDAFAVCVCLSLEHHTNAREWRQIARLLIGQVHHVLGRQRADDARTGWISGLSESEGKKHPTAGGLRIGNPLPERKASDSFDEHLEWERDGQYYHYLTKWMHALARAATEWGDAQLHEWSVELAKAAHAGFCHTDYGYKALYWKMSIDLSRPLVASMGQHDALDGFVTTSSLHDERLRPELDDLSRMCERGRWATTDPLGLGLLLADAFFLSRSHANRLFAVVQRDASRSLQLIAHNDDFIGDANSRLPFRELGLSLGLAAAERLSTEEFGPYTHLRDRIESFWLIPQNQMALTWREHEDINAVMLAASLLPDGYLG